MVILSWRSQEAQFAGHKRFHCFHSPNILPWPVMYNRQIRNTKHNLHYILTELTAASFSTLALYHVLSGW